LDKKDTCYVEYEIKDFRPKLNFSDSIKVLYLTAEYDTAINMFLNNDYFPSGTGNFMNPAFPRGQSYTKYEFLRKYLNIFMGHWGNYWHLVTPPAIQGIDFGFPYLTAKVHFRLVYERGEAEFNTYSGKWQMKVSDRR
jgi:hypothetical protein